MRRSTLQCNAPTFVGTLCAVAGAFAETASAQCGLLSLSPPAGSTSTAAFDAQRASGQSVELAWAVTDSQLVPSISLYTVDANGSPSATGAASLPAVFAGSAPSDVILDGDLLVAAFPDAPNGGAVVVWRRAGGSWPVEEVVRHPGVGGRFGAHIALDGSRLAIGDAQRAEIHVLDRVAAGWTSVDVVSDPVGPLALAGGTLVSGRPDGGPTLATQRVRVYEERPGGFALTQVFGANLPSGVSEAYGADVALDGTTLLVAAPGVASGTFFNGHVVAYSTSVLGWIESAILTAPGSSIVAERTFGTSVQLEAGSVLVGSGGVVDRAYLFRPAPAGYAFVASTGHSEAFVAERARLVGDVVVLGAAATSLDLVDLATSPSTVVRGCDGGLNSDGSRLELQYLGSPPDLTLGYGTTARLQADTSLSGLGQVGLFVASASPGSLPVGGGTLCLGTPFVRLGTGTYLASLPIIPGVVTLDLDLEAQPLPIGAGTSLHFQYWYPDPAGNPRGNLTNSLVVTFCG